MSVSLENLVPEVKVTMNKAACVATKSEAIVIHGSGVTPTYAHYLSLRRPS